MACGQESQNTSNWEWMIGIPNHREEFVDSIPKTSLKESKRREKHSWGGNEKAIHLPVTTSWTVLSNVPNGYSIVMTSIEAPPPPTTQWPSPFDTWHDDKDDEYEGLAWAPRPPSLWLTGC